MAVIYKTLRNFKDNRIYFLHIVYTWIGGTCIYINVILLKLNAMLSPYFIILCGKNLVLYTRLITFTIRCHFLFIVYVSKIWFLYICLFEQECLFTCACVCMNAYVFYRLYRPKKETPTRKDRLFIKQIHFWQLSSNVEKKKTTCHSWSIWAVI